MELKTGGAVADKVKVREVPPADTVMREVRFAAIGPTAAANVALVAPPATVTEDGTRTPALALVIPIA
jgi:hypothetical protein